MSFVRKLKNRITEALGSFSIRREITICLAIIFGNSFAMQTNRLFTQYTSKLLGWPISSVGYLVSLQSFVTLGVLLAFSGIGQFLKSRWTIQPLIVDVWIARFSFLMLMIGVFVIGASREVLVLIIG